MSYAIIRNQNHKIGDVPLTERHNERRNKNYSNKDIDRSRSELNYHIKEPAGSYLDTFYQIRENENLKGNLRVKGSKQSTILCEFVITSDKEFFDRIGEERTRKFFEDAYRFACIKAGGEQYIVSAAVHMDERTPHMHLMFIPVVRGKDRKGQPCKRINCSEFWKGRDSYSRLQDEFHDWVTSHGYDLERGSKGSTAEHLTTDEYKLKKVQEQLSAAKEQAAEIEHIEDIKTKSLPANTSIVKTTDLEALTTAAKGYAAVKNSEQEVSSLKSEVFSLRNENEALKNDKVELERKYQKLDREFGEFYDSVADEVQLRDENIRLKEEVREFKNVRTENKVLTEKVSVLTEKLSALQKIYKSLEKKYDRVMRFIENMKLKEKLADFLKPKKHTR